MEHGSGADASVLRVRAQVLRDLQAAADADASWGFVPMPDDTTRPKRKSRKDWQDADLKRALALAHEAGLTDYRVEISPDGTITIVVCPGAAEQGSD